ncbi:MAG: carbon-nitrogen hydrolase family protein [Nocardiaceae bacterium]|nr:carbon-nitrogen hydrolase family protein [Nocardiaceae bacterium]
MLTVALYQGPESSGVPANLAAIDAAAARAAAAGARILVTPEMSTTGYNIGGLITEHAEPADGPIHQEVAGIARRNGIAVVYGFPESNGDRLPYNSIQAVDGSGQELATYRKTHLFGSDRTYFTPGDRWIAQFDLDGVRCGLLVCYDVEFPENVRAHADSGTELLLVPTGLMDPYGHVATHMVPTRAYESQLFVAYVNRVGTEGELTYCGLSCAIAPDGTELARAGRGEELVVVDIDPGELAKSRAINTHLDDRRRDLYRRIR